MRVTKPIAIRSEVHRQSRKQDNGAGGTRTGIGASTQFDDAFHRLDRTIAEASRIMPGRTGEGAWINASAGLTYNAYYEKSLDAHQTLVQHPVHLETSAVQSNWPDGHQVTISEGIRMYGDGVATHPLGPPLAERHARACGPDVSTGLVVCAASLETFISRMSKSEVRHGSHKRDSLRIKSGVKRM